MLVLVYHEILQLHHWIALVSLEWINYKNTADIQNSAQEYTVVPDTTIPVVYVDRHRNCWYQQCRIKVGAIDAAALGPFVK